MHYPNDKKNADSFRDKLSSVKLSLRTGESKLWWEDLDGALREGRPVDMRVVRAYGTERWDGTADVTVRPETMQLRLIQERGKGQHNG